MRKQTIHSRRVRYGGMTVALTVVLVAAVILLNAIFSVLARHYSWFLDMTGESLYTVSDRCRELLDREIRDANEGRDEPITAEIIFCEDTAKIEVGSTANFIYNTARELERAFPDTIKVSWFNCWVDKKRADDLGVTASTNVVLQLSNGKSRVFKQTEFFVFGTSDTSVTVGYNGERAFAMTLVSLMHGERPLACVTLNHDEIIFDDYQLFYALRDAGYNYMPFDLYYSDIPADCELLVCYNPNADFIIADGVSERSEIDKVNAFLADGGKMMVFLSPTTPTLPNLEALLGEWGVRVIRTYDDATDRSYNCMVKDAGASLTSDGFSVLGEYAAPDLFPEMTSAAYLPKVVFEDSTAFAPADGFTVGDTGAWSRGNRSLVPLFTASENAEAWANGAALHDAPDGVLPMMTLSTDSDTGAEVFVCGSVNFMTRTYMQSPVFGNNDALLSSLGAMGKDHVLIGLRYKPFSGDTISGLTTAETLRWTLWLTITPAVLILAVAVFVLVRRKNA